MSKWILCSWALVLAGCGAGSGAGLDGQGLPLNAGGGPADNSATLAGLQQQIFGAICARCHTGASAPQGLRLDSEANSYAFLVGHPAEEVPELLRVNPGSPDASYMLRKIEGAAGIVGGRMPLGGPYLSEAQISSIRDWIANGAPRIGTGTAGTHVNQQKLRVEASVILVDIHFSRALQAPTLSKDSFQLSYQLRDSDIRTAITDYTLSFSGTDVQLQLRDLPADIAALAISIDGSELVALLDSEGRALDGDNDGVDGGAYHYVFQL